MSARIALVTGGAGGIGTAICRRLARDGYRVAAGYFPADEEATQQWQQRQRGDGFEIDISPGDVSSFDSCAAMVQDVEQRLGPLDVLVNCAGITRDRTLRKMEPDQWRAVLSTNLDSVFNVTRQVVDGMVTRGFGRIINVSSVNGQKGQFGQTNYSAAKAGMHGFTMALAQEVARKGVTVNTVSPGYIATDMTMAIAEDIRNAIVAQVPLGRMGDPDDVAHVVAFLADEHSAYITGANIPVNGGLYMS